MRLFRSTWVIALFTAVLSVGCSADGSGPSDDDEPDASSLAQLVKGAGDRQAWYFENPLPTPYLVTALDAAGQPLSGVTVTWAIVSGGGSLEPLQATTGADGTAETTHTLGPALQSQSVTASASGVASVTFTSEAMSAPSEVFVTVGNDFFSPRDAVVRLGGTVTWTWQSEGVLHNVTYTAGSTPLPQNSPTQGAGSFGTTFSSMSLFDYVCTLHAGMEGSVRVVR